MKWLLYLGLVCFGAALGLVAYSCISAAVKADEQSEIIFRRHSKCKRITMTDIEILDTLQELIHALDYIIRSNEDYERYSSALAFAIENLRWHDLTKYPNDTPDKHDGDWVLVQIVESDGYIWMPKVAEYRESRNDWYCEEAGGWLKDSNGLFKVVAWKKAASFYNDF